MERPFSVLTPDNFAAAGSPEGKQWITALPSLAADLAGQWNLVLGGVLGHGYVAVVFSVSQGGRPLALKVCWRAEQARGEADALTAWQARGVVELVAADLPRGGLLLERLDAARSLASIPVAEAGAIAGAMIRTLAIEASGTFPSLQAVASELSVTLPARQAALGEPLPGPWVALAARLAANLARDPERLMVHTDLHYGNVLASARPGEPWVAVDASAAVGAPERSVAELLWTRADELPGPQAITGLLEVIARSGRLDWDKAVAWAFPRTIDYWLWGLENGLTYDPARCHRVASALAPLAVHQC